MNSPYGLDSDYFRGKLMVTKEHLSHCSPQELARELARLAKTADEEAARGEFAALQQPNQVEPVAWLLCGEAVGAEQDDDDIEFNLRESQRISALNPGARISLYAAQPPAAVPEEPMTLDELKVKRHRLMREAERVAYAYFCGCDIGVEREKASEIYENIRTAGRVY